MKTIVCLGDSITYGYDNHSKMSNYTQVETPYPAALQNLLGDNYQIINSGNTGWQAKQVVNHLNELVYKYEPEKVILMLGINDARGSKQGLPVTKNSYYRTMKKIIEALLDRDIEVLLLTPTPVRSPRVKSFNKVALALAHDLKINYVDMHQAIFRELKKDELSLKDILADRIHLSQAYYIKLAEIVSKEFGK
ncbi:SGNH/GDSL hydrolase family protein [Mollicutes bacterium LVI A0039]|nr:SGNH/GDSL hydrolase family protein [Mollicutes bacterium LVI A0039]